ncbi:MAG: hypothetical protein M1824_002775 [Vezdaea acicularis]|nr:MAG: hypothetical protein M1824_002775 [Vezdaea acicularis]
MSILSALFDCFSQPLNGVSTRAGSSTSEKKLGLYDHTHSNAEPYSDEKRPEEFRAEKVATDVLFTLQSAEKPGVELQQSITGIVHQAGGWDEWIAKAILNALTNVLRAAERLGPVLQDTYDRACEEAKKIPGIVRDHPYWSIVVALGILAILTPLVIYALGFTAEGVLAGSWAAAWQSTYGGFVEAGSLFSYLQKLGTLLWYTSITATRHSIS